VAGSTKVSAPTMFEIFAKPEAWVSLLSLSAMEIVLGVDNIIFISILSGKLPPAQQPKVRQLGLVLALGMRLGLLFALSWLMRLTEPLFTVSLPAPIDFSRGFSGRDLILLVGGLFLMGKATFEIHDKLEVKPHEVKGAKGGGKFGIILVQILLLDIVFSLDSVITAVGMAPALIIMVIAMIVSVAVMLVFAGTVANFVERHPTMKILALSFLLLIGLMLVVEAMGQHVSKGYIYFAVAFSLAVEAVNIRVRKAQAAPVALHNRFAEETPPK
jgi:predicted tellurium resistance membrane protein TerC